MPTRRRRRRLIRQPRIAATMRGSRASTLAAGEAGRKITRIYIPLRRNFQRQLERRGGRCMVAGRDVPMPAGDDIVYGRQRPPRNPAQACAASARGRGGGRFTLVSPYAWCYRALVHRRGRCSRLPAGVRRAGVVELADTPDLGSGPERGCGFESRRPHQTPYRCDGASPPNLRYLPPLNRGKSDYDR